ncbi:uncharacterized protein L969DRAFT_25645 [Mixia osmundae IAM 14324]|uniref:Uridine kinase n=1 Tax=Mixia osmundae (strain CBS 9802 / IAM 14324 / JCM 22182 / KY 12970) TaxID=764103 RepID=G7E4Z9_MIXOS|nr:uncharacterized protein L969DRAFT_25645 [Mixia osmundae IAM 14324]KEI37770.1 hypothetical protein L969DRAFT_25645 [Mixia osmundae IAM 14324]GAA97909.1 hypothetical protein E5Q_04589 [Mixia osmundae IAM 14324]
MLRAAPGKHESDPPKNTILTGAGKAPWYREDGQAIDAFVVGISGGSGSGKTSVAQKIIQQLNVPWVVVLSQDSFYKSLSPEQSERAFANQYDFDSPDAFDYDQLRVSLAALKACKSVQIPVYSFVHHQRMPETQYLYGAAVIIVEGIFVLHDPRTRDLLDIKVYVQCDSDLMLARRLRRDLIERGRDVQGVLDQYLQFVKPSYDNFIQPTAKHADIIVPGQSNSVAIDLITTHIRRQLDERSMRLRPTLGRTLPSPAKERKRFLEDLPSNVIVMSQTPQLRGVHTYLRDQTTSMDEFLFYCDRLATLLVEYALSLLPYETETVTAPTGIEHCGQRLAAKHLCGISILRSGKILEKGLRRVVNDALLGSMLIQSDDATGEPLLYYVKLPRSITSPETAKEASVLLFDSQIGTGAACLMAIRVLLDHGVLQENIIFVCFLVSARGGIQAVSAAFQKVRIVTSACDEGLEELFVMRQQGRSRISYADEDESDASLTGDAAPSAATLLDSDPEQKARGKRIFAIQPGMGSIGDRYFGT